jgi:hypothetical protein
MNRLLTALLISMLFVIAVSGCQEDNSPSNDRRANLIGSENLRLQLKDKDAKIANLQSELDKCTKENAALKAQATKSAEGFMQMYMVTNKKNIALEKENAILKAKIKELEK